MLSKDIEQIKYKDSHGREVIPYWRLQDLIKEAKKEVFDDIEKLFPEDLCNSTRIMGLYSHITDLKRQHLSKKH